MRLFVAVELPEAVRQRLGQRIDQRREGFPRASWVRAENLHLTLAFLGEVEAGGAAPLAAALAAALAGRAGCTARTAGAGAFPEQGAVRVVWLALEPEFELAALAAGAREALAGAGFAFDAKPFRAHVTLARCRARWPAAARAKLAALAPEPIPFAVREVALVESELGSGGPVYRRLASFPLAMGEAA